MLDDDDIAKLCRGRIIKASFYNSKNKDAAGPHYAIILDADDVVAEHDSYFVAVISHNDKLDAFMMPVPGYTGLTGFIQCSWIEEAHLAGITEIGAKLHPPEMDKVAKLISEARKRSRRS